MLVKKFSFKLIFVHNLLQVVFKIFIFLRLLLRYNFCQNFITASSYSIEPKPDYNKTTTLPGCLNENSQSIEQDVCSNMVGEISSNKTNTETEEYEDHSHSELHSFF